MLQILYALVLCSSSRRWPWLASGSVWTYSRSSYFSTFSALEWRARLVSESSNPDLFRAIRGAGHNFGLVTEWECRVYDDAPLWSYEIFIYAGDKVEALYNLVNEKMQDQPPELVYWGYIIKIAVIDPDHVSCLLTQLHYVAC